MRIRSIELEGPDRRVDGGRPSFEPLGLRLGDALLEIIASGHEFFKF